MPVVIIDYQELLVDLEARTGIDLERNLPAEVLAALVGDVQLSDREVEDDAPTR